MTETTRVQYVDEVPAPLLFRAEDVARMLGVGRTKVYELMASGVLPSVKLGGSRRVSATALAQFVASLERGEVAA